MVAAVEQVAEPLLLTARRAAKARAIGERWRRRNGVRVLSGAASQKRVRP